MVQGKVHTHLSIYLSIYYLSWDRKRERERYWTISRIVGTHVSCSTNTRISCTSHLFNTPQRERESKLISARNCRYRLKYRRWRPINALNSINFRRQRRKWTNGKACSARNAKDDPCRRFSMSNTVTTHSKQMEIVVRCLARLARLGENMFWLPSCLSRDKKPGNKNPQRKVLPYFQNHEIMKKLMAF